MPTRQFGIRAWPGKTRVTLFVFQASSDDCQDSIKRSRPTKRKSPQKKVEIHCVACDYRTASRSTIKKHVVTHWPRASVSEWESRGLGFESR